MYFSGDAKKPGSLTAQVTVGANSAGFHARQGTFGATPPSYHSGTFVAWFATMYHRADIRFDEIFIRAATALYVEETDQNEAGKYEEMIRGGLRALPPPVQR